MQTDTYSGSFLRDNKGRFAACQSPRGLQRQCSHVVTHSQLSCPRSVNSHGRSLPRLRHYPAQKCSQRTQRGPACCLRRKSMLGACLRSQRAHRSLLRLGRGSAYQPYCCRPRLCIGLIAFVRAGCEFYRGGRPELVAKELMCA